MHLLKELIEVLAKSLVDNPQSVVVNERVDQDLIDLELIVASEDMGKVIGKQGRIAKAIRTVLKAAATKENKQATLEIVNK